MAGRANALPRPCVDEGSFFRYSAGNISPPDGNELRMNDKVSSCLPEGAPFHSYEDVMDHLNGLGVFHMDMGLGRMERALAALGLDKLRIPTVQV